MGVDVALVEAVGIVKLLVLHVSLVTGLVDAASTNVGVSRHDCDVMLCGEDVCLGGRTGGLLKNWFGMMIE